MQRNVSCVTQSALNPFIIIYIEYYMRELTSSQHLALQKSSKDRDDDNDTRKCENSKEEIKKIVLSEKLEEAVWISGTLMFKIWKRKKQQQQQHSTENKNGKRKRKRSEKEE